MINLARRSGARIDQMFRKNKGIFVGSPADGRGPFPNYEYIWQEKIRAVPG